MPQTKALPRTAVPSDVSYQGKVIRVDPDDAQIRIVCVILGHGLIAILEGTQVIRV